MYAGHSLSNGVMARSGAKTANRRIRTLKALWNWHKSELNGNPWQAVKPFPEEEFVKYVPSKDDVEKVFAAATQQERDILTVISYTGARLSEVLRGCPACFLILKGVVISSHETNRFS